MQTESIGGLLTATLIGAAVGLERQWSGHASGAHAHFGGIRTLALLGAVAGVAGSLSAGPLWPFAVAIVTAAAFPNRDKPSIPTFFALTALSVSR